MLIPFTELAQYGINPTAVCHVGAHLAQERSAYAAMGIGDVLWVEANPMLIDELIENVAPYGHQVRCACLASRAGQYLTFHIAEATNYSNKGQSSSLLPLGLHLTQHPEVSYVRDIAVTTKTLDEVTAEAIPDWLGPGGMMGNFDTQGTELDIMRGGPITLAACDSIYCEVNLAPMYEGAGLLPDLDAFLNGAGFECVRIETAGCRRVHCQHSGHNRHVSWGDGIWVRTESPRPWSETHPDDWEDWFSE